jgi:hypothetical protein
MKNYGDSQGVLFVLADDNLFQSNTPIYDAENHQPIEGASETQRTENFNKLTSAVYDEIIVTFTLSSIEARIFMLVSVRSRRAISSQVFRKLSHA